VLIRQVVLFGEGIFSGIVFHYANKTNE